MKIKMLVTTVRPEGIYPKGLVVEVTEALGQAFLTEGQAIAMGGVVKSPAESNKRV